MENTIAVAHDPIFLEHASPEGHPERPARLEAARKGLEAATLTAKRVWLAPHDASDDELARVHTPAYVESLRRADGWQGYLNADTYCSRASIRAARRAAGAGVAMVDALLDGRARTGLALVRPPGHHARPAEAMGFCFFNNVAVAAAHARVRGAERVAVVDFDVHHGNGTQEMFYADPAVLYVSLHQYPFYPGTGSVRETGTFEGTGRTVNVPLSAGAGDSVYLAAFQRIVAPVLASFDPDLLLISAGFDAHELDPLGSMRVTEAGFGGIAAELGRALPRGPDGRVGVVLEGGYDLDGLAGSLRATLEALDSPTAMPARSPKAADPAISPTHEAELARALAAVRENNRFG
jgi:acetoin utilization deacetylase AcuC-like enzyme